MSNSTFLSKKKIGVVGYGMFGNFFCKELLRGLNVRVYSPHFLRTQADSKVNSAKSLQELVERADLIIPAVPINKFEDVIQRMIPYLKKNTIIMDVCSVKLYPVQIMQKLLPDFIHKIATHPMFGPSSFNMKGTVRGLPMVMYNAGCDEVIYSQVRQYFFDLGLQITEMQPDEHDMLAAKSQFFSQLVRASAQEQKLHPTLIDSPGASMLFESFNVMNISEELLIDMLNYNIHAQKVLKDTIRSIKRVQKKEL